MKTHQIILIQILLSFFFACSFNSKKEVIDKPVTLKPNITIDNAKDLIKKGYTIQPKENYLSNKLLLAKKGKLKGYKSLNIKGDRFYELDRRGNVIASYDITNNYAIYTYDKKNRLTKLEVKQHSPPEIYSDVVYKYSKTDVVIEISKTLYKNNKPTETKKDKAITLNAEDVRTKHFSTKNVNDLYINSEGNKIITYEDDMFFCCGVTMKGNNELIYYINKNELIDSLVITGLESGEKMTFTYEYE